MKIDFHKIGILIVHIYFFLLLSCTNKNDEKLKRGDSADYYKNLFTEEILNKSEFEKFRDSLMLMSSNYKNEDSLKEENMEVTIHFYNLISNDSTIQPFKYSIRVGNEYLIRNASFQKIGMSIPQRKFLTIDNDSVQIGGIQTKPILINLWFVGCKGCEQEMPSLNKLHEKYADKVNFIAITFDDERRVMNFLKKNTFHFKHIVNVDEDYIKQIGTSPYPENIFISKGGKIKYIEGGLSENGGNKKLRYFELLIEELL